MEAVVSGTAGPWDWATGGLNSSYAYGPTTQDFSAPTRIKLSDIGSGAGMDLLILYKSGLVSNFNNCCGGPWGPSGEDTSVLKDNVPGSVGDLPSLYTPDQWGSAVATAFDSNGTDNPNGLTAEPADFGVFLMSLMAVLTDDNGNIVGSPFAIGSVTPYATDPGNASNDSVGRAYGIGVSFQVAAGATYLNLGINDDAFYDNGGAFNVCVASSDRDISSCINPPSQIPEPGTLGLLAIGMLGATALRRRRSRKAFP